MRIPIIASQFNEIVVNALIQGASDFLTEKGLPIEVHTVSGAFELPLIAKWLLASKKVNGLIALGAVIEGETAHFQFVSQSAISGLSALMIEYATPIGLGVLTTPDLPSALNRAGGKYGNKGQEAAEAVWHSLQLKNNLF